MREQTLFQTAEEHQRELQTLRSMQSHQGNAGGFVVAIGVAHQGSVVKKLFQTFAAIFGVERGIHQLAQVFDARVGLRCVFGLELLDVAGAVDQELEEFCSESGLTRRAEGRIGLVCGRLGNCIRGSRQVQCVVSEVEGQGIEFGRVVFFGFDRRGLRGFAPLEGRGRPSPRGLWRSLRLGALLLCGRVGTGCLQAFDVGSGQHGLGVFDQFTETLQRLQRSRW